MRGLTMVELLVTLAIFGVLLAVSVPAMTQFLAEQSAAANADELAEALRFARSEAIKRGQPVSICASEDAAACSTTWTTGWVVTANAGTRVLRVQNALKAMDNINASADTVTFAATGISTGGAESFTFTPLGGDTSRARTVSVNVQGRVVVTKGEGS